MALKDVQQKTIAIVGMAKDIQISDPTQDPATCLQISQDFFNKADHFINLQIQTAVGLSKDDIVECVNNRITDEGYPACEQLVVGNKYQVVQIRPDGMIIVDDFTNTFQDPFYPERFKKVATEGISDQTFTTTDNF